MLKQTFLVVTGLLLSVASVMGQSYTIDRVTFPSELPPEIGGVEFASDGSLYVALRRGDILVGTPSKDPKAFEWRRFANGFHNACGIHVVKPGHIVIGQMAELTEVIDHDNCRLSRSPCSRTCTHLQHHHHHDQ